MIHNHCKIHRDHYWAVGRASKPALEDLVKAGMSRRSAAQRLRRCQHAVLLLVGAGWEQVQISLTAAEAKWIAEELLENAKEVKALTETKQQ
jgi:hypothetical protein